MASRGSYAKGRAKRDEILTTALDVIAHQGYRETSIRELAAAVGLSQTGLLHYFGSKENLFIAVLRKRDEIDTQIYAAHLTDVGTSAEIIGALMSVVRHNTEVPGLVQLYAQFAAEASDPGHPAHDYFRERAATFTTALSSAIRTQQALGALPTSLDADRVAMVVMATSDGLQGQWLLDKSIDMPEHIAQLWDHVTRE